MALHIDKFKHDDGYENPSTHVFHYTRESITIALCLGDYAGTDETGQLALLYSVLSHFNNSDSLGLSFDDLVSKCFHGDQALAYIVCNLMLSNGVLECGVSVRCSWLTEKGKQVFEDIKAIM